MDYKPDFPTDVEVRSSLITSQRWLTLSLSPQILFHCLCCYLDDPATLYIPSAQDVMASESRSFSTLHVVKTPDVRARAGQGYMCFVQPSSARVRVARHLVTSRCMAGRERYQETTL